MAFKKQRLDRQFATENASVCYVTMDLQQTMPLPKLTPSKPFYLRQMWYYNFGVHTITTKGHQTFFFNWTEDWTGRGSLEIGSCLLRDSIKWLRVEEYRTHMYKETLNEADPFMKLNVLKTGNRKVAREEVTITRIEEKKGSLSEAKIENLQEPLMYVKEEYR
ncbi:unnamed protein product [Brassicogethes aeneus]|uniref:Uncharacterized protein n=1 Tax=Brassicogethes aeneus TaxID=1431903 RepID=A0A9P0FKD3_BRAAE|nr:unnamed protein product [Brassicogethes aeneus]